MRNYFNELYSRTAEQNIRIVYRDIGAVDSAEEVLIEERQADERQMVEMKAQEEPAEKTA